MGYPDPTRILRLINTRSFLEITLVVWDVDLLSKDVVRVYRADKPENPIYYCRGETAEAEPAVPGWKISVDDLFID